MIPSNSALLDQASGLRTWVRDNGTARLVLTEPYLDKGMLVRDGIPLDPPEDVDCYQLKLSMARVRDELKTGGNNE